MVGLVVFKESAVRVFGHRARLHAGGDYRLVLGAVHSDGDILALDAAIAVVDLHREGQRYDVVGAQEVDCAVGKVVVPGD